MNIDYLVVRVVVVAAIVALSHAAQAQTFDAWVDQRVQRVLNAQTVAENGTGAERQRESPSDSRSTSLVDQSSGTDFVAAAIGLAGVADPRLQALTGTGTNGAGVQTVSASGYALLAALNGVRPTDPEFYKNHVDARRVVLTLGTAASDRASHNTDRPAQAYGAKVLIVNKRELFQPANLAKIQSAQKALSDATAAGAVLKRAIQEILFFDRYPHAIVNGQPEPMQFVAFLTSLADQSFAATIAGVDQRVLDQINERILASIAPFAALQRAIRAAYDEIKGAQQLAVGYTVKMRPDTGYDEHRAELIWDYGLSPRITWTANGSLDVLDKKSAGSTREGRFAMEFVGDLTRPSDSRGRLPVRLSAGTQFKWGSGELTQRDLQAKLTVPLTVGVDLPIVYRYTRFPQTATAGAEAKAGLSIDFARIMHAR